MTFFAERLTRIHPSPTLVMNACAANLKAQGRDIISLSAGEPDFDTPQHIKDAAQEAMRKGLTKYTPVEGTADLRKAIQQKFARDNNLTFDLDQITVGNGAKQVIMNAFIATINEGDEVIIPSPYWVSYPDMVHLCSGKSVIIPCPEQQDFKLTADMLESKITLRTKWVILNSPSNPTGSVYSKEDLQALAAVLAHHPHVHILSDDIYEHLIYDNLPFATLAAVDPSLQDRILTVNGVSKSHSMTGWRIGFGAGSKTLIKAMTMIQSHSTSNACSLSQAAAIEALSGSQDFLGEWVSIFQSRRNLAFDIINAIDGLSCLKPEGAFYLYINCEAVLNKVTLEGKVIGTDHDLALYLLDSVGVACVSGDAFGLSPYLRISYAVDTSILEKGCHRIRTAIQKLQS